MRLIENIKISSRGDICMKINKPKFNFKDKFKWIRYEVFLMIAIILGLMYMNLYENMVHHNTFLSVSPDTVNIAILHNSEDARVFAEQGWPIIEFPLDATQFITLYDENQNEISQIILGDIFNLYNDIDGLQNWWDIFERNEYGYINLSSMGSNMIVNYQWIHFDDTSYLLVYNTDISMKNMLNAFNIVSYATIILSFIALVSAIYWRYHGLTNTYKKLNEEVQKIIHQRE